MTSGLTWLGSGTDGPPLVFLHGIGGGAAAWAPQLAAFAGRHRCLAWNMPGYHGSAPLKPLTFPALADRLLAFLDERDLGRVHLVGHSMGGMIALELAATRPDRLRSLTLAATSAAFGGRADPAAFRAAFLSQRLAPLDSGRTMAELAPDMVRALVGEDPDPDGVARAAACMAAVDADAYRAALACLVTFDRREALGRLRLPVLLVAGGQDRTVPADTMARMAERIAGSRLATVAAAGHLVNLEQPAAFDAALADFLATVPGELG